MARFSSQDEKVNGGRDAIPCVRTSSSAHQHHRLHTDQAGIHPPLKFKLGQATSTIFLAAAIFSFPTHVDPLFASAAWANFLISALHHGYMIRVARPSSHRESRLFGRSYSWACSDVDESRRRLRVLAVIDRAVVGYICLYTGCAGLGIPRMPVVALVACLLSACLGGNAGVGGVLAIALYLTVPKVAGMGEARRQALFCIAAIAGPICFLYMYRIGAWCAPYRYLWHLSCGCLVSVGGALNSL
mmetsp:Transcript_33544/g.72509  ORF Transcript_33544/g.72509 Transcript_33544/m.72509 type:complete len:244 (+) Transcript_33544:101-832(+)